MPDSSDDSYVRDERLLFLPLGGAGEIGMNLYLYGYGPEDDVKWLMVDLGVKFGDDRDPGIDVIYPDIGYIEGERANLVAIVLTHAHEDHFGAVIDLWPRLRAPVLATPFAASFLLAKLTERGLQNEIPVREIALGSRLEIGPFDIEFITMTHSIPEPNAIALRTRLGNVLHTGDWKLDDRPMIGAPMAVARLRALGAEGCRAMICDSTNVLREGISPSESDVAAGLAKIIANATRRVAVTTFASNVGRLRAVALAARAADRHLVVVGRAMYRALNAARDSGYLDDIGEILTERDYGYLPREKVVCLCTGSQGEPRAALSRISEGSHPNVTFNAGDMVIFSSRTIPGNEKAVAAVENNLAAQGIEIVTAEDHPVHVTGHPRRGELRHMYDWIKPEAAVPMHGEMRHLVEHERFARELGVRETIVARNGDMVRLAPAPLEIVDQAPAGRLHLDGRLIVPSVEGPARERRKLSFSGCVAVSLVLDRRGEVVGQPVLELMGLPQEDDTGTPMHEILFDAVDSALRSLPRARRRDDELVRELVRRAVRKEAAAVWGKKPLCRVLLSRL